MFEFALIVLSTATKLVIVNMNAKARPFPVRRSAIIYPENAPHNALAVRILGKRISKPKKTGFAGQKNAE